MYERRILFLVGAGLTFFLAGFAGVALSERLIEWLGLDDKAGMYVKLECFLIVLIAIGWTYDRLRGWWASRQYNRTD